MEKKISNHEEKEILPLKTVESLGRQEQLQDQDWMLGHLAQMKKKTFKITKQFKLLHFQIELYINILNIRPFSWLRSVSL